MVGVLELVAVGGGVCGGVFGVLLLVSTCHGSTEKNPTRETTHFLVIRRCGLTRMRRLLAAELEAPSDVLGAPRDTPSSLQSNSLVSHLAC